MPPTLLDPSRYARAEQLLRHHRTELVPGAKLTPRWLPDGSRFWYRIPTPGGARFVLADPQAGRRADAFDHERLAKALAVSSGAEVDPAALPFAAIEPTPTEVIFDALGQRWACSLDSYECRRVDGPPPSSPLEVLSPDGRLVVYRTEGNLRVRQLDGGGDRALTTDGDADHDYGANPDYLMYSTLLTRLGLAHLPPAIAWSPDGTRILTHRTVQAGVRPAHLIDPSPPGGGAPVLVTQRSAVTGDEHLPLAELAVIEVATGRVVPAAAEPVLMPVMSPLFQCWAWWSDDGTLVYYLSRSRDARTLRLHEFDAVTGATRTVLTESGSSRVEPAQGELQAPIVRVLAARGELLWFSQRDGWGHLYRYDARRGTLLNQVTSGPWCVQQILHVDDNQVVYFTATGLVGADPSRRTVCRVGLDGSGFGRITDDELDHAVTVPPAAGYFISSASTTEAPPVITARGWDGAVLVELERADHSRLIEAGWRPPERFRAKSADGSTEVWGLLYKPHDFDPDQRYPVIDTPYGLPGAARVSPTFDPGYYGYDAEALAALGFVVLAIDGRGSPGRSKAFHDASYANLAAGCGLEDHVAALRELASARPWMDLTRVGIVGQSGGGFAAVRAMIDFPEVFHVGVAESGMHDLRLVNPGLAEPYHGPYDETRYAAASNVDQAARISGTLLLVHGGLDDRVSPQLTLRLAERLVAADKDFELLIVPGADHIYFGYEHYVTRRRWDFLVRNLLGCRPPAGYRLTPAPFDPAMLADLFG